MKLCPSSTCLNPDGSSTLCPVQNKVCYTCGHLFVNRTTAQGTTRQQRDREMGAKEELKAAGKYRGRGEGAGGRLEVGGGKASPYYPINAMTQRLMPGAQLRASPPPQQCHGRRHHC